MKKESLIIIGAGAAGLMAGYLLADRMQVIILEAQDETGGRIKTIRDKKDHIELGAEFIHGDLPVTLSLVKEAGLKTKAIAGNIYRHRNGKFIEEEDMIEGWNELMKQMKALREDMTLTKFLIKFFPGKKYAELRKEASSYAEGFDLADAAKASVKTLYSEWDNEDENNYRITSGYGSLTGYLEKQALKKGAAVHTGMPVNKIVWKENNVSIVCKGRKKFSANKLLITVPLPVLANDDPASSILFTPPLPAYQKAAKRVGFGHVIKITLRFKKSFWKRDSLFIISNEIFKTWWTQLADSAPIITGWVGGPAAKKLSRETDKQLLEKALSSLSAIYLIPVNTLKKELVSSYISNPQKNKFAPGGYSYSTLSSPAAKKVLNTPVKNTIFFAGEALYKGKSPGTVEAALISGKDAAGRIMPG